MENTKTATKWLLNELKKNLPPIYHTQLEEIVKSAETKEYLQIKSAYDVGEKQNHQYQSFEQFFYQKFS